MPRGPVTSTKYKLLSECLANCGKQSYLLAFSLSYLLLSVPVGASDIRSVYIDTLPKRKGKMPDRVATGAMASC